MGGDDQLLELVSDNQRLLLAASDARRRAISLEAECFELSQRKWWIARKLTVTCMQAHGLLLANQLRRLARASAETRAPSSMSSPAGQLPGER